MYDQMKMLFFHIAKWLNEGVDFRTALDSFINGTAETWGEIYTHQSCCLIYLINHKQHEYRHAFDI